MATTTSSRVAQDAALVLRTVRDEIAEGRKPYASDVRRLVERSLALRFAQYVQFMERYGFVVLDRRTDLLTPTRAGNEVAEGDANRLKSLEADAVYHFGDQLSQIVSKPVSAQVQGTRFDTRYLRYETLGCGGIGTVWRGRLLSIDRPVAIKIVDQLFDFYTPDQREELIRRLQIVVRDQARLISPFVVQILDQNTDFETPYCVMELATGGSLRQLLDRGALDPAVALRYFIQISLALRMAHNEGILHRDLKPQNVLLDAAGNVKISDFGITRVVERDGQKVLKAYVGFGSVGYLAPEQFQPGADIDATVDIYSLGILLYEMLTGRLPGRRSPMPSEIVEGLPGDMDDIFDQMTQDDPSQRPSRFDAVLESVWRSSGLVALLDARQAPFFIDSPTALPGLPHASAETEAASPATSPRAPTPAPVVVAASPDRPDPPRSEPALAIKAPPPRSPRPTIAKPRQSTSLVDIPSECDLATELDNAERAAAANPLPQAEPVVHPGPPIPAFRASPESSAKTEAHDILSLPDGLGDEMDQLGGTLGGSMSGMDEIAQEEEDTSDSMVRSPDANMFHNHSVQLGGESDEDPGVDEEHRVPLVDIGGLLDEDEIEEQRRDARFRTVVTDTRLKSEDPSRIVNERIRRISRKPR